MRKRLPWAALLLAVPLFLSHSRPAQAQVVVVTARSVDTLVGDLEYLVSAAAPDEEMKQGAQQGLDLLKDPTLLPGIDRTKPFGAWVTMPAEPGAADPPTVVVAVPVTDLKALLDTLQNFGVEVDNQPGVAGFSYRVGIPGSGLSLYAVEAKGYAYLTMVPQGAEKLAALTPANWMPIREGVGDLSASVRMDQVPQPFKDMLLEQVEQRMVLERNKMPGEDEAAFQGRLAGMKFSQEVFERFVRESRDLNLDLIVDKAKEELSLDLGFAALKDTSMAKSLAGFSSRTSSFQAFADPNSAMAGWASLPISPELQKTLGKSIGEGFTKALAAEKNPADKALLERAQAIVKELVDSGSFDTGMSIREVATPPSGGTSVLVAGARVPDAKKLEDLVRDAIKAHPPGATEAEVTLDAGKAPDGTSLHRIKPVLKPEDAAGMQGLGEPIIYLAFRKDQVLLAVGASAEAAIVKALGETAGTVPATAVGNPLALRLAVDKLAMLADTPADVKASLANFFTGKKAGKNQVDLSVGRGPADSLRVRLRLDLPALAFLAKLGAIQQQGALQPVR